MFRIITINGLNLWLLCFKVKIYNNNNILLKKYVNLFKKKRKQEKKEKRTCGKYNIKRIEIFKMMIL